MSDLSPNRFVTIPHDDLSLMQNQIKQAVKFLDDPAVLQQMEYTDNDTRDKAFRLRQLLRQ